MLPRDIGSCSSIPEPKARIPLLRLTRRHAGKELLGPRGFWARAGLTAKLLFPPPQPSIVSLEGIQPIYHGTIPGTPPRHLKPQHPQDPRTTLSSKPSASHRIPCSASTIPSRSAKPIAGFSPSPFPAHLQRRPIPFPVLPAHDASSTNAGFPTHLPPACRDDSSTTRPYLQT